MSSKDIERFSTWARYELQTQVELRAAFYGIAETDMVAADAWELRGRTLTALEREQRASLVEQVQARGYAAVVEEATYTWFNRFVALRFMDVNGYLETGASWFTTPGQVGFCPEVLAQAHLLNLDGLEVAEVERYRQADDEEGLFRYLLGLQCAALSHQLPRMFTPLEDWTLLLCPAQLLRETGLLARMVADIPDEDWTREVEIVGWMYQYYNSVSKAEVYARLKKGQKVEKEDLAPATQLFTPDWIVRYLVQNSLGRLWMYNHPHSSLAERMEYYCAPAQVPADFPRIFSPEELKICDPACGSGHMLTYAFELLFSIYEEEGYAAADIPALILRHNLHGIDLDQRAGDLAWFALMMKSRRCDRRFLRRGVQPNICVLQPLSLAPQELTEYVERFGRGAFTPEQLQTLQAFAEADNFGSLIRPALAEPAALYEELKAQDVAGLLMLRSIHSRVLRALEQADYLCAKYHVVVANPPYLGARNMNARLKAWAKTAYADSKAELFAMFMARGMELLLPHGFNAMVTMQGWMFLSRFEKLRSRLLAEGTLVSLAHLGTRAFEQISGEVVSTSAFVFSRGFIPDAVGDFIRLTEEATPSLKESRCREAVACQKAPYFFRRCVSAFSAIPGEPIAYWLSARTQSLFEPKRFLGALADTRIGLQTGDNDSYLRLWTEVSREDITLGLHSVQEASARACKWVPYNKGGSPRKWYGNREYVVNWAQVTRELRNVGGSESVSNTDYFFRESVSWTDVTTSLNTFRYYEPGFVHDVVGMSAFGENSEWRLSLLACCNTPCMQSLAQVLNPTIHFQAGDFAKLPYAERFWSPATAARAQRLIEIAKADWDDHETSWDFATLPLLRPQHRRATLAETYAALRAHWQSMTEEMARLEEENNRSFNELYELGDEFPAAVPPEQITLSCNPAYRYGAGDHEDLLLADTVKELISWAVGCMFGRYSLATPGLAYAGGNWHAERYGEFPVDADNIIPICDDDYFPDDICGRFVDLVRLVFGAEALEQNLSFIAEALGGKGTARDVIRNYFLKDFYADHLKAYSKRPIYWQFDSGKKGGFRALVYLHRYTADTLALMRTDYVFRQQERYRAAMADFAQRVEEGRGRERVALSARLKKISEQEAETAAFEQALHHLANARISLDLDAGVVANYARFSPILTKIK